MEKYVKALRYLVGKQPAVAELMSESAAHSRKYHVQLGSIYENLGMLITTAVGMASNRSSDSTIDGIFVCMQDCGIQRLVETANQRDIEELRRRLFR